MRPLPAFDRFPQHANAIGRIVIGYGELEFALAHCVSQALDDPDRVFRAMFRERGEMKRINVARDLGRAAPLPQQWIESFDESVEGMHHCREIRNQYAHCNWLDNLQNGLSFVQLEEIAKDPEVIDLRNLTQHMTDLSLLDEQVRYLAYVEGSLDYLNFEAQLAGKRIRANPHHRPNPVNKPALKVIAPAPTPLNTFRKR